MERIITYHENSKKGEEGLRREGVAREALAGVDPYDDKREKQDCGITAFKRMAPWLRKLMRKFPLCLVGDALYV